ICKLFFEDEKRNNQLFNCNHFISFLLSCYGKKESKVDSANLKTKEISTPDPVKNAVEKSEIPGDFSTLVPLIS
ncbi:hypothetical protein, partial [Chryseobacterium sp. CH1]|uniref:hypothetical protein n=1 Tax=Chryseobacterium sp. CH1 TaxID=713551 RepID=UPI001025AA52